MSKMSELSQALDELVACGEGLIRTANAIRPRRWSVRSSRKSTFATRPACGRRSIRTRKRTSPASRRKCGRRNTERSRNSF